jgi:hypothetical protein
MLWQVRERPGLDGAYEILIFGEPVGPVALHVTLDGRHVLNSPCAMAVVATSATSGRCYAFGPGLGSKGPVALGTTARFTLVACDVSGTRRRVGGDAFKVVISPVHSAHHLTLRVKIYDGTNGAYTVSWTPPFSGAYHVHVTLRGLPIFGSPFLVSVKGGGRYAYQSREEHAPYGSSIAAAVPDAEQTEAAVERVPSPTLQGLISLPAGLVASPPRSPTVRSPGRTTRPVLQPTADAAPPPPWKAAASSRSPPRAPKIAFAADDDAFARLSAAALRAVAAPDVPSGVERAVSAARREGLAEMLLRFKQAVAADDADEEHTAALRSLGAPVRPPEEEDGEEATGGEQGTPWSAGTAAAASPRSRATARLAFSPD